jgi:hypothetical protein
MPSTSAAASASGASASSPRNALPSACSASATATSGGRPSAGLADQLDGRGMAALDLVECGVDGAELPGPPDERLRYRGHGSVLARP